jgi:hypothetical protein
MREHSGAVHIAPVGGEDLVRHFATTKDGGVAVDRYALIAVCVILVRRLNGQMKTPIGDAEETG